ncbi:ribonuclease T [Gammaproteobacteria bacterium]|nr:ribonuclease T [Gammaproteobacteria bacterium]
MPPKQKYSGIAQRFRGLLPVVIDVETSGLNPYTDALLEIAAVSINMDVNGKLFCENTYSYNVEPFVGANFDQNALNITGIDPTHPLRYAIPEKQMLHNLFSILDELLLKTNCRRAVLVGHNAWFDLAFIKAAIERSGFESYPLHSFTTFDTATLAAATLGETVLAKAMRKAKIYFDVEKAHSAIYDTEKTAQLFCQMLNRMK